MSETKELSGRKVSDTAVEITEVHTKTAVEVHEVGYLKLRRQTIVRNMEDAAQSFQAQLDEVDALLAACDRAGVDVAAEVGDVVVGG